MPSSPRADHSVISPGQPPPSSPRASNSPSSPRAGHLPSSSVISPRRPFPSSSVISPRRALDVGPESGSGAFLTRASGTENAPSMETPRHPSHMQPRCLKAPPGGASSSLVPEDSCPQHMAHPCQEAGGERGQGRGRVPHRGAAVAAPCRGEQPPEVRMAPLPAEVTAGPAWQRSLGGRCRRGSSRNSLSAQGAAPDLPDI